VGRWCIRETRNLWPLEIAFRGGIEAGTATVELLRYRGDCNFRDVRLGALAGLGCLYSRSAAGRVPARKLVCGKCSVPVSAARSA
jgi:hypothetical protein